MGFFIVPDRPLLPVCACVLLKVAYRLTCESYTIPKIIHPVLP